MYLSLDCAIDNHHVKSHVEVQSCILCERLCLLEIPRGIVYARKIVHRRAPGVVGGIAVIVRISSRSRRISGSTTPTGNGCNGLSEGCTGPDSVLIRGDYRCAY